ncbi:hypothetical protein I203_102699 [Kwoniella mangroviensis CBS 8507]|uniref:uncharacterized protein n=1 Tax=Kwoniella mangroviensis CBS 8507 TaxID=1296122 RepID=UPI00306E406B
MDVGNIPMIGLVSHQRVYARKTIGKHEIGSMIIIGGEKKWAEKEERLRLVPFFARSNRDSGGRLRTMFPRVAVSDVE